MQEVQKRTLTPKWDEDKWLLVQEPKTQIMRVQMFDHDMVNLKAGPPQLASRLCQIGCPCVPQQSIGLPCWLICGHSVPHACVEFLLLAHAEGW